MSCTAVNAIGHSSVLLTSLELLIIASTADSYSSKISEGKVFKLREFAKYFIFFSCIRQKKKKKEKKSPNFSCGTSEMIVNMLWSGR